MPPDTEAAAAPPRSGGPREQSEEQERAYLDPRAALSTNSALVHRVYHQEPDSYRTEFERDYTRIIHSRAFRRLRHKAQVFAFPANDHVCTRLEHSLHVASVARTIAKALRLNTELVAAIAVGHDLGHAPFGHRGEESLDRIAQEAQFAFVHELHSLRVVDRLESSSAYKHSGLNLTFAVRDGIACHCGERLEQEIRPDRRKEPGALGTAKRGDSPATLEACVVRWADKAAYLGRDLEDAMATGLLRECDIPASVGRTLGVTNRQIIATLVSDIDQNSYGRDVVAVSSAVLRAVEDLSAFSTERIYRNPEVTRYFERFDKAIGFMFDALLPIAEDAVSRGDAVAAGTEGGEEDCVGVFRQFLREDVRSFREETPPRLVVDFIAGMTDNYFVRAFTELFVPQPTILGVPGGAVPGVGTSST